MCEDVARFAVAHVGPTGVTFLAFFSGFEVGSC